MKSTQYLIIGIFMLIHSTVFAITYNWNGVDADWDNPKAWTPMGVPGANDRAFIAAGEVTIPDQYNAEALSVHLQGGVLQITEDGSLSINNNSNLNAIWIYGLGSMVVKGQLHISNQLNQRFMTVEGRLHIDDTGEVTMDECTYCNPANGVVYIASSGGIVNDGLMSIQNANVAHGIELSGAFQNNGILNVNHVNGDGFKLSDSSALLENYGTINLTAIYDYGLNCQYGTVHNEGNGSINMINGSSGMYIRSNCTFRMRGQSGLLIDQPGSNTAVRNYGHFTAGVNTNIVLRNGTTGFFNRSTAILRGNTIIESYDTGMNNRNASLDIYGSVSISNNENPLPIRNSTINIFSGGSLNLQDSGDGLYLLYDSQFNNYGELNLQNITDDYSKGIRMVDDSQFDNYGNILIQSVSGISSNGIVMDYGSSTFKNHSTGVLEITDGDDIGILADENTTFINDGELHIDNFKFGIFLTGGSFFNQSQSEFLALSITNAALKITEGGYLLNTGTFSHVDYINALNSLNIQKGSVLNSSCGYMSLGARIKINNSSSSLVTNAAFLYYGSTQGILGVKRFQNFGIISDFDGALDRPNFLASGPHAAILDPSWNSTGANGPIYAPIDVEPTSQSTFDNWYTSPGATQIAGIYMGVSVNDFYPSPVADGLGILWIECHLVGTSCPTLMPMTISNNINLQNTPTDQLSQQNSDNAALHSDKQRSRLFPNPASELLHISLSQNQSQAVDYRLLSANGQLLSRGTLRSDVLDVSHLPQGSYFLHLATEQDNWMEKFIIQR